MRCGERQCKSGGAVKLRRYFVHAGNAAFTAGDVRRRVRHRHALALRGARYYGWRVPALGYVDGRPVGGVSGILTQQGNPLTVDIHLGDTPEQQAERAKELLAALGAPAGKKP